MYIYIYILANLYSQREIYIWFDIYKNALNYLSCSNIQIYIKKKICIIVILRLILINLINKLILN